MNKKTILLLITLVILIGAPTSFAKPEYLTDLIKVYGEGSCDTCHVNGTGGPRTPYGTLFEEQPDHATNASTVLLAMGEAPPTATSTITPIATPEETATLTATPAITTVSATPASPGFGIVFSVVGLFTLFLLIRKRN